MNQGVGELVPSHHSWWLFDYPGGKCLLQGLQYGVFSTFPAQGGKYPEIKLPSDYGSGGQHLITLLRQPVETLPDYLPDALGYFQSFGCADVLGGQFSTFRQQFDDFGHEKGIALGVGVKGIHQPCGGLDTSTRFDDSRCVLLVQASQENTLESA